MINLLKKFDLKEITFLSYHVKLIISFNILNFQFNVIYLVLTVIVNVLTYYKNILYQLDRHAIEKENDSISIIELIVLIQIVFSS